MCGSSVMLGMRAGMRKSITWRMRRFG